MNNHFHWNGFLFPSIEGLVCFNGPVHEELISHLELIVLPAAKSRC